MQEKNPRWFWQNQKAPSSCISWVVLVQLNGYSESCRGSATVRCDSRESTKSQSNLFLTSSGKNTQGGYKMKQKKSTREWSSRKKKIQEKKNSKFKRKKSYEFCYKISLINSYKWIFIKFAFSNMTGLYGERETYGIFRTKHLLYFWKCTKILLN